VAKEKQANNSNSIEDIDSDDQQVDGKPVCGIIMPIASTPGYPDRHWGDVYDILCEVATKANFKPRMVSFDDDIGVIHKRIVQNIYNDPIVICDISSRNANVMFELGMRLAFDKATIIVKDNQTPFSFDISAIEHLEYPSDLRYQAINDFKKKLESKILETYKRSIENPEYSTFLKQFGTFKVSKLDEKEAGLNELLLDEFKEIKKVLSASLNRDILLRNKFGSSLNDILTNSRQDSAQRVVLKSPGLGVKGRRVLSFLTGVCATNNMNIPSIISDGPDTLILEFSHQVSEDLMHEIRETITSPDF
ncbi:hypothetical protein AI2795V1_1771, partial [Serratia marcescens]